MPTLLKLDIHKFRKVRALMERGSTEGEREAARSRAEAIADKACMALDAAIREDDWLMEQEHSGFASEPSKMSSDGGSWKDAFNDMFKEARERKQERQERRKADVFTRYRTVFDVFEPTDMEKALRKAVQPFSQFGPGTTPAGHRCLNTIKLDKCVGEITVDKLSKRARSAIEQAVPIPKHFAGAMQEVKVWDDLEKDRAAFTWQDEWRHEMEVAARIVVLEDILNNSPAKSWDDLQVRFDWNLYHWKRQWLEPTEREDPFMDRIEDDFKILRAMSTRPLSGKRPAHACSDSIQNGHAQNGRRTNADKATEVRRMLIAEPEMSDRAIGRAIGVSPQTVTNWRNRLKSPTAT